MAAVGYRTVYDVSRDWAGFAPMVMSVMWALGIVLG